MRKGWTFYEEQDYPSAREQFERLRPHLLLVSPMAMTAETIRSRNHDERERMVLEAKSHMRFLAEDLISTQRDRGGKFVLEFHWKAATWQDARITQLSSDSSVHRVQVGEDMGWPTKRPRDCVGFQRHVAVP